MNINLKWFDKEPKNIKASMQHITQMMSEGYLEGELCELDIDEKGEEEELRGWWKLEK